MNLRDLRGRLLFWLANIIARGPANPNDPIAVRLRRESIELRGGPFAQWARDDERARRGSP